MNSFLRFIIFSLIISALAMALISCTQSEDVIQPQGRAELTLNPINLPELNDSLYIYELWAVRSGDPVDEYTSLGKFKWDKYLYLFRDTSDQVISNVFELPDAWSSYDFIAVTIENIDDDSPEPSGTIMLRDTVLDPNTRPIALKFPVSLFPAYGYFFVGTPTDKNYNTSDEQKGIWLCSRTLSEWRNQDTLGIFLPTDTSDTAWTEQDPGNPNKIDRIGVYSYDVDSFETIVFGYDTIFDHIRLSNIVYHETIDPNNDYILTVRYDTTQLDVINYFAYSKSLFQFPTDINDYGWRYQAWVMLEKTGPNASLELNRSWAFSTSSPQRYFVGDSNWVVLSLGAFLRTDSADLKNQYLSYRQVPNYPGEDFIVNPPSEISNLDLRLWSSEDVTGQEWGSLVIGLEPDPAKLEIDTTTNFPLFFLSGFLRSNDGFGVTLVGDTLHNWSNLMPVINVDVNFIE